MSRILRFIRLCLTQDNERSCETGYVPRLQKLLFNFVILRLLTLPSILHATRWSTVIFSVTRIFPAIYLSSIYPQTL